MSAGRTSGTWWGPLPLRSRSSRLNDLIVRVTGIVSCQAEVMLAELL